MGLVLGPRDRLVLELQRQRNDTKVQTGRFGGAPKRSDKTWFRTWPSNANSMADPWRSHAPETVGGPSPAFVWLLRRDWRATHCGHSAKSRPTTGNSGSAIWRHH